MQNNIIIISRSDTEASVPKIIVRARNDKESSSTIEAVRTHLLLRHSSFEVCLTTTEARSFTETNNELPFYLINRACSYKRPFVNNDFDYLRRSVRKTSCRVMYTATQITVSYDIEYLTTLYQEEHIDRVLQSLFKETDSYKIRDILPRIKFAYDYIITNVNYDNTFVRHSAYNALIEKTAVCEGCAQLLYRMLSMFGIPCRIITGRGLSENHAWNIVCIDGRWYNADVTWDLHKNALQRNLSLYDCFLIGGTQFAKHKRDAEFSSPEFLMEHPMAKENYR